MAERAVTEVARPLRDGEPVERIVEVAGTAYRMTAAAAAALRDSRRPGDGGVVRLPSFAEVRRVASADHPPGDLPPVGDEHALEHGRLAWRKTQQGTMARLVLQPWPMQGLDKRLPLVTASGESEGCRPYFAVWEITLRCDQHCRFCGTRAGKPLPDELDTEEALRVVDQLAAMGTREVTLHGGEAYLRDDWLRIVASIREHGMDCTMVTGGRGLTLELCRAAKRAGITAVSVSIDGTEPVHDALRGLAGSHASALRALRDLRQTGISVGCNTQLNRMNYRLLPEILESIAAFPIYGWQVQLMVPMGRAADAEDLWLQPFHLLEVIPRIAEARLAADARGIKLWPGNNVGYFGPFEDTLRSRRSQLGYSTGCGGGRNTVGVEANGNIKGCSAMATAGFVGGNVRHTTVERIWQDAPELRITRDFALEQLWGRCRSCYYAEVCKGGCVWTAATLLGRHGNNPYCHHRAVELLAAGLRERLLRREQAPGQVRDTATFELRVEPAPADWVATLPPLPGATGSPS